MFNRIDRSCVLGLTSFLLVVAERDAPAATFVDSTYHLGASADEGYLPYVDAPFLDGGGELWFDDAIAAADETSGPPSSAFADSALAFAFVPDRVTVSATAHGRVNGVEASAGAAVSLVLDFELEEPGFFVARGELGFLDVPDAWEEGQTGFRSSVRLADAADLTVFGESLIVGPLGWFGNDFVLSGGLDPGIYTLSVDVAAGGSGSEFYASNTNTSAFASLSLRLLPEPGSGLLLLLGVTLACRRSLGRRSAAAQAAATGSP